MAELVYATDGAQARIATPLDGLTLIYHRPSGATHLLAEPAPEILAALDAGPADAGELLVRLGAVEGDAGALAARLAELVETGLVRAL
jgi:PqqD family protein of HPr-rel-A system